VAGCCVYGYEPSSSTNAFWVMKQRKAVLNRRLWINYVSSLQGSSFFLYNLTLEDGTHNSETSVSYHLTPPSNPEDGRILFNRGGSLRSRIPWPAKFHQLHMKAQCMVLVVSCVVQQCLVVQAHLHVKLLVQKTHLSSLFSSAQHRFCT
jgi:hypothetical protein